MSGDGAGGGELLSRRVASRRRADLVKGLRRLSRPPDESAGSNGAGVSAAERCDLCGTDLPEDHRHLIHLTERQIVCACEPCFALRSGDAELRPTGTRVAWIEDLDLPDELWARFDIPIGLAFLMRSGLDGSVVALYPSPAGATESEIEPSAWEELIDLNPTLRGLEADGEALIVNRMAEPHLHVIAPIDECYRLVGMIKASWEGISGGAGPEQAVAEFFGDLRRRGVAT